MVVAPACKLLQTAVEVMVSQVAHDGMASLAKEIRATRSGIDPPPPLIILGIGPEASYNSAGTRPS